LKETKENVQKDCGDCRHPCEDQRGIDVDVEGRRKERDQRRWQMGGGAHIHKFPQ